VVQAYNRHELGEFILELDMPLTMKEKAIVVVTKHSLLENSGANLRLQAVLTLLERTSFQIEVVERQDFLRMDIEKEVFGVGVAVSFTNLFAVHKLSKCSKFIWLDSVDSIVHTRLLGLGRYRVSAYLKGVKEIILAILLSSKINLVTYISERDRNWDRLLFKKVLKLVFPNNRLIFQDDLEVLAQEILFIGDTNYNSNRKAISKICQIAKKLDKVRATRFTIVTGTNTSSRRTKHFRNGSILEFTNSKTLEQIYHQNAIHLIPIWNSVGIKNKVVEPASIGIPVIAGNDSFNGLNMYGHMHSVRNTNEMVETLHKVLNGSGPTHKKNFDLIQIDESILILDQLTLRKNKLK
jgi:hypothetical protein